jgi:APA family basic amino acid/polyamine antiporter
MLSYFMSMLAAIRLLPGERWLTLVALTGAAFIGWATWGLGASAVGYGAVLVAAGLPVYWAVRRSGAEAIAPA